MVAEPDVMLFTTIPPIASQLVYKLFTETLSIYRRAEPLVVLGNSIAMYPVVPVYDSNDISKFSHVLFVELSIVVKLVNVDTSVGSVITPICNPC